MLGCAAMLHTMIRKLSLLTGVAIIALTLIPGSGRVSALNNGILPIFVKDSQPAWQLILQEPEPLPIIHIEVLSEPPEPKPVEPVKYTVLAGDNLSRIAAAHSTSWLRLWNKNTDLNNPDLIYPGQVFLIPPNSEELEDRPVPAAIIEQMAPIASAPGATRGPVAGNTYSAGYCTWYVKNRRPDLPNNLGDAHTWYGRAAAQGYTVGSVPRAGAVGTTTRGALGHVVFVERVNGDGTILISEMNYRGLWIQSSRTTSASEFTYIY